MVTVRPVVEADHAEWSRLYEGYAAFYGVPQAPEMRALVWEWIWDPDHEVECRVALNESGRVIGLAHFREFARPLAAAKGGFLDDLFVDPDARGSGAADALIDAVREVAVARGWSVVRWITAEDNYRARAVYDRVAVKTRWRTYDLAL